MNKRHFYKQKSMFYAIIGLRFFVICVGLFLIGTRIFVGTKGEEAEKQLFNATQEGNQKRVKDLLLQGINPDVVDKEKNTPIFFTGFSALYGDQYVSILKTLLDFYADVNHQNFRGETVLHASVRTENATRFARIFGMLFSYGIDIDIKERNGNTMLHELARINAIALCNALLASYADIFGIERIEQAKEVASRYTFTDFITVLDKYLPLLKTNTYVPKDRGINELILAASSGEDKYKTIAQDKIKKSQDGQGNNLLHFAVMKGNVDLVKFLLEKHVVLAGMKNNSGSYPIHFLVRSDVSIESRKKMALLFEKYQIDLNQKDGTGSTLLHLLIRKNDSTFIRFFFSKFQNKIKIDVRDRNGETPRALAERINESLLPLLR